MSFVEATPRATTEGGNGPAQCCDDNPLIRDLVEDLGEVLGPLLLEPGDGVLLGQALPEAHAVLAQLPPPDAHASTLHDDVEIHTVDTRVGVVLDAKIDVLRDTETPVPVLGEVLALKLELLDGTGHPVTALAHGDVQNQFIDLNFAHDIVLVR